MSGALCRECREHGLEGMARTDEEQELAEAFDGCFACFMVAGL